LNNQFLKSLKIAPYTNKLDKGLKRLAKRKKKGKKAERKKKDRKKEKGLNKL